VRRSRNDCRDHARAHGSKRNVFWSTGQANARFCGYCRFHSPPTANAKLGKFSGRKIAGNPATDFVTLKAEYETRTEALGSFQRLLRQTPSKHVLVFVHRFNNRFEDAVFRYAQIIHDSSATAVPVLFTWPSRGSVFAYGYDHESASYSRDALEGGLRLLAKDPEVGHPWPKPRMTAPLSSGSPIAKND